MNLRPPLKSNYNPECIRQATNETEAMRAAFTVVETG
jgi:hypothetical protein